MPNVLLITSDQHNPFFCGYAGDSLVTTPSLDGLAAAGTTFGAAYTNNPICMPARASLVTGRYGSLIGSYDNGSPYHPDQAASFGHRLRARGHPAITFGKLHFAPDGDSGFDMRLPLQAKKAYAAAIHGWARGYAPPTSLMTQHALDAQPGPSEYELYDRHTTSTACRWLVDDAPVDRPWAVHVSFAYPHYPFRAPTGMLPAEHLEVPLPPAWQREDWPRNAELDTHRHLMGYDERPLTEDELRQLRWIYAGMVNFVDEQIGRVLYALEASGQADDTIVIYTSDHGDMLGSHGFLMKSVMYDASARVPMVIRGPGVDPDRVCDTAVSLVDVFPTVLEATAVERSEDDADLPGQSLISIAGAPDDPTRAVFSEYHGPMSAAASFMIRRGDWKYVRYMLEDTPAQLFDMAADPDELDDRINDPAMAGLTIELEAELVAILDPDATDQRVRAEQQANLAAVERPPRAGGAELPRTALGTIALGWSVPPPEIMAVVDPQTRAT